MAPQMFDQLLKKMSEHHAESFIRLAFPDANFRIVATALEKELIFKEDFSMLDELMQVPYIGEKIKDAMYEGREEGLKEGMKEGMKEGIKEGIKEGKKEGKKEGIREGLKSGMQQGIRDNIIEVLKNRFSAVNGVKDMISSIEDIDRLKKIFRLSLTIESFEEFRSTIAKMKEN